MSYPFNLVQHSQDGPLSDPSLLSQRPYADSDHSFQNDARLFVPGEELEIAINTAIAVGEPLLITGEPGTGKTQAAYYAAYKLGIEPVLHFQVKSDTSATDLLYHFDTVRYFHDAHLAQTTEQGDASALSKADYIEPRALWNAFEQATKTNTPCVLLIDEIDKAPRDFPNDLLHELDKMEFTITETGQTISAPKNLAPIVFITSNSERRLPEPFLRRYVYHHIGFDDKLVEQAVNARKAEFSTLSDSFIELALRRFFDLRDRPMRKSPATGELLVWLRVLSLALSENGQSPDPHQLDQDLSKLPHLGVLLKDHSDIDELSTGGRL